MPRRLAPLLLPAVLLLLHFTIASAAQAPQGGSQGLTLILHGSRSIYGDGTNKLGWGAGGAIRCAVSNPVRIWAGVEGVRTASEGPPVVLLVTPWTLGVEFGPRVQRRIEPFFRLGLGLYRLERRGEFMDPITGQPTPYAISDNFGGLNFGGGGQARLTRRAILELGVFSHQILGVRRSEIPGFGGVHLLNLRAGLGYSIK